MATGAARRSVIAASLPSPGLHSYLLGTSVAQLLSAQACLLEQLVDTPCVPLRVELPRLRHTINAVVAGETLACMTPPGQIRSSVDTTNIAPSAARPPTTAVLCHGLGAALGFFFPNIDALLRANGGQFDRVVVVDWLGFGGSSRPRCSAPRNRWWRQTSMCRSKFDDNGSGGADAAAAFFVDPLEEFREVTGIGRFTLIGHSLGGYLSAR